MIPYGRQYIGEEEIQAVADVLESAWLTQGPKVSEFESALASYCHTKYCVAVNNGTSALHLACLALDVGPGDRVWTSPISFVASANCARYCGATVDFVDIDPKTRNLSVSALADRLEQAQRSGQLPKVIIPVHFAGNACDMCDIHRLAQQYGVKIIEDASHAIGGRYKNTPIGSCEYSDITTFSFHPVKNMATGEGGAVLTNNDLLAEKMKALACHGITRNIEAFTTSEEALDVGAPWYYEQQSLGFNFRLTDIQAALGIEQLKRLDDFVLKRRQLFADYQQALADLPLILPEENSDSSAAWHIYVVQLQESGKRRAVFEAMLNRNIGVNVHYIPIHTQPEYRRLGFSLGDFPVSEAYYRGALTLPLFPDLSQEQQDYVIESLREVLV